MESQPQNPEFRINPENFHPWTVTLIRLLLKKLFDLGLYCLSTSTCILLSSNKFSESRAFIAH